MPLDFLGWIAVDAAGESMHKSKEKKKLEAAKDDPAEYARILEEIEKRKERNNKITLYLFGLILIILIFHEPMVIVVFFLAILFIFGFALRFGLTSPPGEEAEARTDSDTSPRTLSPSERQELMSRKCSVPGCNTGNFRMTDYCHKHQDHISSNSESNPEPNDEENWWEDEQPQSQEK